MFDLSCVALMYFDFHVIKNAGFVFPVCCTKCFLNVCDI